MARVIGPFTVVKEKDGIIVSVGKPQEEEKYRYYFHPSKDAKIGVGGEIAGCDIVDGPFIRKYRMFYVTEKDILTKISILHDLYQLIDDEMEERLRRRTSS